jgi:hypothetical protein
MRKVLLVAISIAALVSCYLLWERQSFSSWIEAGRQEIMEAHQPAQEHSAKNFPPLLQTYLNKVLAHAPKDITQINFDQEGLFRMSPEETMSKFSAHQLVSVGKPMFSWEAQIRVNGLPVTVCDRLISDKGEVQARLFGSVKVAHESGPELLRGELLRYLAELPWYPMAIPQLPQIHWREIDEKRIEGMVQRSGVIAKVEYEFSDDGLIKSIYVPDRGMIVGDESIPTPWLGEFSNYQMIENIIIPKQGEVSWLLQDGKFTYFQGHIVDYSPISGRQEIKL